MNLYIEGLTNFLQEFPEHVVKEGVDIVHITFSDLDLNMLPNRYYHELSCALSVVMNVYVQDTSVKEVPFHYTVFDCRDTAIVAMLQFKLGYSNVSRLSTGRDNEILFEMIDNIQGYNL